MTQVAIIGAGPCGLSMLHSFKQAEYKSEQIPEIVCYEKQEDWGGLWNYSWRTGTDQYGDSVPNSMYRSLWSNAPKECLEFGDYSFDEHFGKPIPSFPPRAVLYDYLIGRATKHSLKKYIRFNSTVQNVTCIDNKFSVTVWNKLDNVTFTEEFDFVVVASGHFSVPNIPEYPGMNAFSGRILHSHDFRSAEEFSGKDLIVLGSSYSAEDIALQCYKSGAKSVSIGYRHNPMGFKWPSGVREVHYLDRLEGKTAYFKDGHTQEADAIILCSGYLHYFPFMQDELKLRTTNSLYCPDLYKGVVWQKNPKLFYLGMQNQFFTFPMFDAQTWYVRDVIMGKITLPPCTDTQQDIEKWLNRLEILSSITELFDFQSDYLRDFFPIVDCPKFDIDLVVKHFNEWEHHKRENILTYRDKSFASAVTGTSSTLHHTDWLHAMDDSLESFLPKY